MNIVDDKLVTPEVIEAPDKTETSVGTNTTIATSAVTAAASVKAALVAADPTLANAVVIDLGIAEPVDPDIREIANNVALAGIYGGIAANTMAEPEEDHGGVEIRDDGLIISRSPEPPAFREDQKKRGN